MSEGDCQVSYLGMRLVVAGNHQAVVSERIAGHWSALPGSTFTRGWLDSKGKDLEEGEIYFWKPNYCIFRNCHRSTKMKEWYKVILIIKTSLSLPPPSLSCVCSMKWTGNHEKTEIIRNGRGEWRMNTDDGIRMKWLQKFNLGTGRNLARRERGKGSRAVAEGNKTYWHCQRCMKIHNKTRYFVC